MIEFANLQDICYIRSGHPFRTRMEHAVNSAVKVIQMRDIAADGTIDSSKLMTIAKPEKEKPYFAQKGDIIFRSRSIKSTAVELTMELENTIIAHPLLQIRMHKHMPATPGYIAWYINQPPAQTYIDSRATGSIQKIVGVQQLRHLPIPLPPLEQQHLIAELSTLTTREHTLSTQIADLRHKCINALLLQQINSTVSL